MAPITDVVSVSESTAVTFLQGQCSQDLATPSPSAVPPGPWCSSPGARWRCAIPEATQSGRRPRLLLDTDGGWGEALLARLNRFKLRTKADIVALDWRCLALRGPGTDRFAGATGDETWR